MLWKNNSWISYDENGNSFRMLNITNEGVNMNQVLIIEDDFDIDSHHPRDK